ncbi:MAG TPA: hypothetical protein PLX67_02685, partial [bacterium]|nr:hypothetical protein [bacterium]
MAVDYLKIGRATDLTGWERRFYRFLEIIPGLLSWGTLLTLIILSYFHPVWVALFIIAFDVYWLLLVVYLAIILISAYRRTRKSIVIDWHQRCLSLQPVDLTYQPMIGSAIVSRQVVWSDLYHLVIFPCYNESYEIIQPGLKAIVDSSFPKDKMIFVLAIEERGGAAIQATADRLKAEYGDNFFRFQIVVHPDNLVGELKGK